MSSRKTGGLDLFYPIAPNASWVARLAAWGARCIQLRSKDARGEDLRREISWSLSAAARHGRQLIVNDYWREAIDLGADFIHLGQEDLAAADLPAIRRAGLRFGVSTHDEAELETALAAKPDYVALGPIYNTALKAMKWEPQGLARIGAWKRRVGGLPLVAIGGITLERAPGVVAAGADSIAAVTDIVASAAPEDRTRAWVDWARPALT